MNRASLQWSMLSSARLWAAGFWVTLLWMAAALSINVTRPWTGHWDWNGAVWSEVARNHLRLGLSTTLGVPVIDYYGGYYIHHPPVFSLLVTSMFALFGEHEWAARMVPIACSLASAGLLWALVRSGTGWRAATLSVAVFALLPMELYYGRMVNHEPCALALMLGAFLCLRYWQLTDKPRWLATTVCLFVLAMWTTWHAYILAAIVAGWLITTRRSPDTKLGWMLVAAALVAFLLFLVHVRLARADAWQDLIEAFVYRLDPLRGHHLADFTWKQWLGKQWHFLSVGIPPLAWVLAMGGAIYLVRHRATSSGMRWVTWIALSFLAMAVVYLVLLRQGAYMHDYAGFYFVVPVAIMGGSALDAMLASNVARRAGLWAAVGTIALLAVSAYGRMQALHGIQYHILDWANVEPPDLIPSLGQRIARTFPEDTSVICNFSLQGPQLAYYARRALTYDRGSYADWVPLIVRPQANVGGVIWLGAPGAADLLSALPEGTRRVAQFGQHRFAFWMPGARQWSPASARSRQTGTS